MTHTPRLAVVVVLVGLGAATTSCGGDGDATGKASRNDAGAGGGTDASGAGPDAGSGASGGAGTAGAGGRPSGSGGTAGGASTGGAGGSAPGGGGPDGSAPECRHRTYREDAYAFELRIVNTSDFYKLDFPRELMPHCIGQRSEDGVTDPEALETKCEASYLFKRNAGTAPAAAVTESFDVLLPEVPGGGFDVTLAKGGQGATRYEIHGFDGTLWLAFDSSSGTVHVPREALKPGELASRIPAVPVVGPKRGAYMFPWYGAPSGPAGRWVHWNPSEPTLYLPEKGQYDSADPGVIAAQMAEARSAGLDLFVVSYWDGEDPPLSAYLDAAEEAGLEISAMLETATRSADSPRQSVANQLAALNALGAHPAWLKADGKPIVFVYDRVTSEIDAAPVGATGWDDWEWILSELGAEAPLVMFPLGSQWGDAGAARFGGAFAFAANSGGGGLYTGSHGDDFAWAWRARQAGALLAIPILPSIGRLREPADEPNYRNQWHAARSVLPDMIIVNSWNEYHESTIIEPTTAFGSQYLDLTADEAARYCRGEIGSVLGGS